MVPVALGLCRPHRHGPLRIEPVRPIEREIVEQDAIEAYLDSARLSLYFTAGYARCVTIIQVMASTDRQQARRLFQRLERAQPAQPIGRKLLGPLLEDRE